MFEKFVLAALSIGARIGTSIVLMAVCARVMGVSDFGTMMYWLAVGGVIAQFVDFGMPQRVSILIARNAAEAPQTIQTALLVKAALTVIAIIAVVVLLSLSEYGYNESAFALPLIVSQLLLPWGDLGSAVLRINDEYKRDAMWQMRAGLLSLALVIPALLLFNSIVMTALAFLCTRLVVGLAWLNLLCGLSCSASRKFDLAKIVKFVRGSSIFALDAGATNVFASLDTLIGRSFLGTIALGNYQAGMRLVHAAGQLSGVLQSVLLPAIAKRFASHDRTQSSTDSTVILYSLSGLTIGIATALLGGPLILLVFGPEFSVAASLAGSFGSLVAVRFLAGGFGLLLMAQGRPGLRLVAYALAGAALSWYAVAKLPDGGLDGLIHAMIFAYFLLGAFYAAALSFTSTWYKTSLLVWPIILLNIVFIWNPL